MKSLEKCIAYCGMTKDFISLTNDSAPGISGENITVTLPPAPDEEIYCIVSGNSRNGTILFRGRTVEPPFGMWLLCYLHIILEIMNWDST